MRVSQAQSLPPVYTHVSLIFVVSNAALAPFLYSLRSQTMQAEVRRLFPHGRQAEERRTEAAARRARTRSTQSAGGTPSGDGEETPGSRPGTPRTRFNVLGHPTYIRDSSMDSDSSGMTGMTAVSVESTEMEVQTPIHQV